MVQYGERLIARRKEFVDRSMRSLQKIHYQKLTGGKESLT